MFHFEAKPNENLLWEFNFQDDNKIYYYSSQVSYYIYPRKCEVLLICGNRIILVELPTGAI